MHRTIRNRVTGERVDGAVDVGTHYQVVDWGRGKITQYFKSEWHDGTPVPMDVSDSCLVRGGGIIFHSDKRVVEIVAPGYQLRRFDKRVQGVMPEVCFIVEKI